MTHRTWIPRGTPEVIHYTDGAGFVNRLPYLYMSYLSVRFASNRGFTWATCMVQRQGRFTLGEGTSGL